MEELVRVRVPSVRLQREVRQQFEQITNAVFDRLEPYLKHAFRNIERSDTALTLTALFAPRALFADGVLTGQRRFLERLGQTERT